MKGFIELELFDSPYGKILVNINQIGWVQKLNPHREDCTKISLMGYDENPYDRKEHCIVYAKETYEEVKQKIEEATI